MFAQNNNKTNGDQTMGRIGLGEGHKHVYNDIIVAVERKGYICDVTWIVEGRLCPCRIKLAWNVTFSGVKNAISKRSVYYSVLASEPVVMSFLLRSSCAHTQSCANTQIIKSFVT